MSRPYVHILPGSRGRLFATLVQLEAPVTVRALAGHAGISPQGALTLVNELERAGLVSVTPAGRALLVSLNRAHLAAEPLTALMRLRARLVERLTLELAGWPGLAAAWLYGSTARGDGGAGSDVDILVVADASVDDEHWARDTARLLKLVRAWTGNALDLAEHTAASFAGLVTAGNPLVAALRADGIPLTPGTLAVLRGAA